MLIKSADYAYQEVELVILGSLIGFKNRLVFDLAKTSQTKLERISYFPVWSGWFWL
jgi:hypothetical protein